MPKPRRPFKFWAMAVFAVLASLLGLLFIVVGPTADVRFTGGACLLFFGVGGFAYLGGPGLSRRGPGTVQRQEVQTSAGLEPAFVFPTPGNKRLAMTIGAGGMAGGAGLIAALIPNLLMIAAAVVFGLFFLFMLVSHGRPQRLVLTPTRVIVEAAAGAAEVPWDAIEHTAIFEMPAGPSHVDMLGIAATDPDAVIWTRGGMLGRLGRGRTGYELAVGADTFAGAAEDVVGAIDRYCREKGRRRHIGGATELEQLRHQLR